VVVAQVDLDQVVVAQVDLDQVVVVVDLDQVVVVVDLDQVVVVVDLPHWFLPFQEKPQAQPQLQRLITNTQALANLAVILILLDSIQVG
jgi:hypothetical protein